MEATTKDKSLALTISIVVHLAILLLLMYSLLTTPDPPLSGGSGMVVNLGYVDESTGDIQPMSEEVSADPILEETKVEPTPPVDEQNNVVTQENEETEKVVVNDKPVEEKKEIKKEEIKKTTPTEVQKTVDPRTLYKGKGNNSTSQGNSNKGTGDQGAKEGDPLSDYYGKSGTGTSPGSGTGSGSGSGGGNGKGPGWNLSGRAPLTLPEPEYSVEEQGKVVVEITVDQQGNVIRAVAGAKGSTTTNIHLLKKAEKAALTSKFKAKPDAPEVQKGTITYNFILK